jgi:hypothetical protein
MPSSKLQICVAHASVRQIDNVAYAVGLSERVRTRVEEFGRVELRDTEAAALVRSKVLHVVLIVVAVLVAVWSGAYFGRTTASFATFLIPFLAFWLGGVAEAVATPGAGAAEKIKGIGKATAAAVLGFVGVAILIILSFENV